MKSSTLKIRTKTTQTDQNVMVFEKFSFKIYPVLTLLTYVSIHLVEEAMLNTPLWMYSKYNMPVQLSYSHWLLNNTFFFLTLAAGLIIYLRNEKMIYLGVGILFWSILNSIEHFAGTVIFQQISPGFFSSFIFVFISVLGLAKLNTTEKLNYKLLILSLLVSILYWIIPMGIIILTGNYWLNILY